MKTLYFKESKYLEGKFNIALKDDTKENYKKQVKIDSVAYPMIEELPENGKIQGYCAVSSFKKKIRISNNEVDYFINEKVPVLKKSKHFHKIIGYVKVLGENDYFIACIKKSFVPLFLILLLALGITVYSVEYYGKLFDKKIKQTEEPSEEQIKPGNDEKGTGELGKEAPVFSKSPTFRLKLNCTPTIENGKINIRLESPAEDNKGFSFITEVYILGEIDDYGELIKEYETPNCIYISPYIYANENVENGTLTKEVEAGRYLGRALYKICDEEGNFLTQTACKLIIKAK